LIVKNLEIVYDKKGGKGRQKLNLIYFYEHNSNHFTNWEL